eukprot:sb/3478278/
MIISTPLLFIFSLIPTNDMVLHRKPAPIRNLEVDELIFGIITEKPKGEEVKIFQNAKWSPVTAPTPNIKKEPTEDPVAAAVPIKRCRTDDYKPSPQMACLLP